ncbi:histidine phosphatase family protein [Lysinibacillus sp. 54212]|uniref:histidine phosphatase family protein n=1 Tax=Lysinibacillus sp. 54212 TaxID=3119829 RepID=UPI002FCB136B
MKFNMLLNGGFIVYFRHGEATIGKDYPTVIFSDCQTQRNLSETGRWQARIIGTVFSNKGIPVEATIISSPFCRAINTARIAFPNKNICINYSLAGVVALSGEVTISDVERSAIIRDTKSLLELPPAIGQNRIIIGHSFPKEVMLGDVPYLTGIVIKPKGWGNGYEIIGKWDFSKI